MPFYITKKQKAWRLKQLHVHFHLLDQWGRHLGALLSFLWDCKEKVLWNIRDRKNKKVRRSAEEVTGWSRADYPEEDN